MGHDPYGMGIEVTMTEALHSIAAWVIDHWPGLFIPLILLCGAAMVYTATVWALRRLR